MKLYAVRDRLIDYFQKPFCADTDKQVLNSAAEAINRKDNHDPIAQTPWHFEIWRLADINEDTGKVTGNPEFLADASSLVRGDVREGGAGERRAPQSANEPRPGKDQPRGLEPNTGAHNGSPTDKAPPTGMEAQETDSGPH